MNVFLWIVQAILAAVFALAGVQKANQPKENLRPVCPGWRTSPRARCGSSASWNCLARSG